MNPSDIVRTRGRCLDPLSCAMDVDASLQEGLGVHNETTTLVLGYTEVQARF